jgi:hypothetical protein
MAPLIKSNYSFSEKDFEFGKGRGVLQYAPTVMSPTSRDHIQKCYLKIYIPRIGEPGD